jgi:hypothetical protein
MQSQPPLPATAPLPYHGHKKHTTLRPRHGTVRVQRWHTWHTRHFCARNGLTRHGTLSSPRGFAKASPAGGSSGLHGEQGALAPGSPTSLQRGSPLGKLGAEIEHVHHLPNKRGHDWTRARRQRGVAAVQHRQLCGKLRERPVGGEDRTGAGHQKLRYSGLRPHRWDLLCGTDRAWVGNHGGGDVGERNFSALGPSGEDGDDWALHIVGAFRSSKLAPSWDARSRHDGPIGRRQRGLG